jgi:hypothetical protein
MEHAAHRETGEHLADGVEARDHLGGTKEQRQKNADRNGQVLNEKGGQDHESGRVGIRHAKVARGTESTLADAGRRLLNDRLQPNTERKRKRDTIEQLRGVKSVKVQPRQRLGRRGSGVASGGGGELKVRQERCCQ